MSKKTISLKIPLILPIFLCLSFLSLIPFHNLLAQTAELDTTSDFYIDPRTGLMGPEYVDDQYKIPAGEARDLYDRPYGLEPGLDPDGWSPEQIEYGLSEIKDALPDEFDFGLSSEFYGDYGRRFTLPAEEPGKKAEEIFIDPYKNDYFYAYVGTPPSSYIYVGPGQEADSALDYEPGGSGWIAEQQETILSGAYDQLPDINKQYFLTGPEYDHILDEYRKSHPDNPRPQPEPYGIRLDIADQRGLGAEFPGAEWGLEHFNDQSSAPPLHFPVPGDKFGLESDSVLMTGDLDSSSLYDFVEKGYADGRVVFDDHQSFSDIYANSDKEGKALFQDLYIENYWRPSDEGSFVDKISLPNGKDVSIAWASGYDAHKKDDPKDALRGIEGDPALGVFLIDPEKASDYYDYDERVEFLAKGTVPRNYLERAGEQEKKEASLKRAVADSLTRVYIDDQVTKWSEENDYPDALNAYRPRVGFGYGLDKWETAVRDGLTSVANYAYDPRPKVSL